MSRGIIDNSYNRAHILRLPLYPTRTRRYDETWLNVTESPVYGMRRHPVTNTYDLNIPYEVKQWLDEQEIQHEIFLDSGQYLFVDAHTYNSIYNSVQYEVYMRIPDRDQRLLFKLTWM